jgi:LPPG:FO 2-phospho-L-lactate transferase
MNIVALAGGVGGAKLADGFAQLLPPENLTVIVNTGDDFEFLGLNISPDLDTVCYTLAGVANPDSGWGYIGETYNMLNNLQKLGGPSWFRLGDTDLATHIERTRRIHEGQPLSQITRDFSLALGVSHTILPMSDQPVRTIVDTAAGALAFQEYFVHQNCVPKVNGFRFDGIEKALPAPGVIKAIQHSDAVIICPSNPWVSIDPILAVDGIRESLAEIPVIAISPIINERSFKGPAAKMFSEMGFNPSANSVAEHYGNLLKGFILDKSDIRLENQISVPTRGSNIVMVDRNDRRRLAEDVLNLIKTL